MTSSTIHGHFSWNKMKFTVFCTSYFQFDVLRNSLVLRISLDQKIVY